MIHRRKFFYSMSIGMIILMTLSFGCYRGRPSTKPPIHLIPDMDSQPKYEPQSYSAFFQDHSSMRNPISGTFAQGQFPTDLAFTTGKTAQQDYITRMPVAITLPLMQHGQERYNIFCSTCHSRIGDGQGIMIKRGYIPPPSFHDERLIKIEDGYLYEVISNGIRNMPPYAQQIPIADRWAIAAYLRALQRSQHASEMDVPEEIRTKLR